MVSLGVKVTKATVAKRPNKGHTSLNGTEGPTPGKALLEGGVLSSLEIWLEVALLS